MEPYDYQVDALATLLMLSTNVVSIHLFYRIMMHLCKIKLQIYPYLMYQWLRCPNCQPYTALVSRLVLSNCYNEIIIIIIIIIIQL